MAIQETPEFAKEADRILGRVQHDELLTFLGMNPTADSSSPGPAACEKCAGRFRGAENGVAHG